MHKLPILLTLLAATAGAQTTASPLSLGDLESRMTAQGITIREIELRDHVAEIEGRDAQGRKIELLVDRRSGEILSRKVDL
ncbi:MAG TPA: PepSY domain-containing protein [Steroidobacteraceae bacterium]|nr:PepSY domain-containing protein [Steroidobacteraceae bacterium]